MEHLRKLKNDKSLERLISSKRGLVSPNALYGGSVVGSPTSFIDPEGAARAKLQKVGFGSSAGKGNEPGLTKASHA